jgi:hypothetical protein
MAQGTYISTSDLQDIYGTDNINAWSDLEGGRTQNDSRIQKAIDYAERYIQNKFARSRYSVPFVTAGGPIDQQLTFWMAAYAGDWLYRLRSVRRGPEAEGRTSVIMDEVDSQIDSILAGQGELNLGVRRSNMPTAPFVVLRGGRVQGISR